MRWGWLIAVALLAVAAVSVWFAFQRVDFVAGLTALAAGAAWRALAPDLLRRKTPAAEARDHADFRQGIRRTITGRDKD